MAAATVAIGASTGGAVTCSVLFASYSMVHGTVSGAALGMAVAMAGLGGLAGAAGISWALGRTLETFVRRVLVSAMAVMGSALMLFLTTLADMLAGRWGLAGLGLACIALIALAYRIFLARPA